ADRGLWRDHRPQPPGGVAPSLVEAAFDPRLVDGHAGGLQGRLRPNRGRGTPGGRPRPPARGGPRGARAPGGGPAARQDHSRDTGLNRKVPRMVAGALDAAGDDECAWLASVALRCRRGAVPMDYTTGER